MDNEDRSLTITVPDDVQTVFYSWDKKHLKGKGHYIRVFQDIMLEIAKDRELNLTDHRILMVVLSCMEFENRFGLAQGEISKMIDVDRANVSRSLQKLEQRKFVVCVSIDNRKKIYTINPHLAFKTKSKCLADLEDEWGYLNSEHHQLAA
jgi:DNA-binding MarR family transcriptional regulator